MNYQKKFELTDAGKDEAVKHAKERTKETGDQHYVIASGALDGMGHWVENEPSIIRPAFEHQVYPKS